MVIGELGYPQGFQTLCGLAIAQRKMLNRSTLTVSGFTSSLKNPKKNPASISEIIALKGCNYTWFTCIGVKLSILYNPEPPMIPTSADCGERGSALRKHLLGGLGTFRGLRSHHAPKWRRESDLAFVSGPHPKRLCMKHWISAAHRLQRLLSLEVTGSHYFPCTVT